MKGAVFSAPYLIAWARYGASTRDSRRQGPIAMFSALNSNSYFSLIAAPEAIMAQSGPAGCLSRRDALVASNGEVNAVQATQVTER